MELNQQLDIEEDALNEKAVDTATPVEPIDTPQDKSEPLPASSSSPQDLEGLSDVVFSKDIVSKLLKRGLKEPDVRPHLNVVFIGHVDAGKSTTCGNILFSTGQVDSRTIEKYEREAKEKNRDTWYFAYVMDINDEERVKGKTVEVGRAPFELEKIRYTILDAPGHKGFVPEMLSGASQADVGVLLISARKGEFEAGFDRGGQTREHALLAKTLGVNVLIVAVNKMDESTVNWDRTRYETIQKKLAPFLKSCGFNPASVYYVPISGLNGQNIKDHVSDQNSSVYEPAASWYTRESPTLFELLESLKVPNREESAALRIPILSGFRDGGVTAVGKVESGVAMVDQPAMLMPNNVKIKIIGVRSNDEDYAYAKPGENVELKLIGVEEDQLRKGCVISSISDPVKVATVIEVQLIIVELLEHRPLLTCGYKCVMHMHTLCEEVELDRLVQVTDKQTKKVNKRPAFVKEQQMAICHLRATQSFCVEQFSVRAQLGRFTLRDEGKTIAIGKVLSIVES